MDRQRKQSKGSLRYQKKGSLLTDNEYKEKPGRQKISTNFKKTN